MIPTCIVRPAVVVVPILEPIPYYIDNYTAINGIGIGLSTGLIKVILCDKTKDINCTRLDMVILLSLLATIPAISRFENDKDTYVLNITGENTLSCNIEELFNGFKKGVELYPSQQYLLSTPNVNYTTSSPWFTIQV